MKKVIALNIVLLLAFSKWMRQIQKRIRINNITKKSIALLVLILLGSYVFGQVKIAEKLFIYEVELQFKDGTKAKGALFEVADSVITLGSSTDKKSYESGLYKTYSYPFDLVKKLNRKKIASNQSRLKWLQMIKRYDRWAIVKSQLKYEEEIAELKVQRKKVSWEKRAERRAKRDERLDRRAENRMENYTPTFSIDLGESGMLNFEYPILKWNSINVFFGNLPANIRAKYYEDETIESMIHVAEGTIVNAENLQDFTDFEYVPISCHSWFCLGTPTNETGLIEVGKKSVIPIDNIFWGFSFKSYLGVKPSSRIRPYVELGWASITKETREMNIKLNAIGLFDESPPDVRYQIIETVTFGEVEERQVSQAIANVGCRLEAGKRRRILLGLKFMGLVPNSGDYVSFENGKYTTRNYGKKRFRFSVGWVF